MTLTADVAAAISRTVEPPSGDRTLIVNIPWKGGWGEKKKTRAADDDPVPVSEGCLD